MSTPTALYRLFGDEEPVLYIGISKSFMRRWYEHSEGKAWWLDVRRATLEWFPDEETALAAEKAAIKAEHPRYNVAHNKPQQPAEMVPLRIVPAAPEPAPLPRARPAARPAAPEPEWDLSHHEVAYSLGLRKEDVRRLPVTIDISEAAAIIGMDRKKARELAYSGEFPCRVLVINEKTCRVATHALLTASGVTFKVAKLRSFLVTRDAA